MNGPPGPVIRQCCPPWGRDGAANGWGYPSPRRPPAGIGPPGGRDVRMDWGLLPTRSVARCAAGCPGRARKSAPAAHRRDFRRVVAPRWSSPVYLCRQSPSGGLSGSSGQGGRRSHFPAPTTRFSYHTNRRRSIRCHKVVAVPPQGSKGRPAHAVASSEPWTNNMTRIQELLAASVNNGLKLSQKIRTGTEPPR